MRSEQCGQAVARAKAIAKGVRESPPVKAMAAAVVANAIGAAAGWGETNPTLNSPLKCKKIHFDDELLPAPPAAEGGEEVEGAENTTTMTTMMTFDTMPPSPPPTAPVSRASSAGSAESWIDCGAAAVGDGGEGI